MVLKDTVKPRRLLKLALVLKLLFLMLFRVCIISPVLRKLPMTLSAYATICAFSRAVPPPCDGNAPLPLWERQQWAQASRSSVQVVPGSSTSSFCSLALAFPRGKSSFLYIEICLASELVQEPSWSPRLPKPLLTLLCGVCTLMWYTITHKCLPWCFWNVRAIKRIEKVIFKLAR